MDLRTFATRSSIALWLGIAGLTLALSGVPSSAAEVLRFGVNQATIAWPPPSDPLIDAYIVYVSRNGGAEQVQEVVDSPLATLEGDFGDKVVARVRALGRSSSSGALVASDYSPPSPSIRFLPAPTWNADGLMALHCASCAEIQVRTVSNQGTPVHQASLPAPWRLVDIGPVAPNSFDEIWQNEDTGGLLMIPFGAGVANANGGSSAPNMDRYDALELVELDGDGTRELLVRDVPSGSLMVWEYRSGTLVPIGGFYVPPTWTLGGSADLDGDGLSELWWQTDDPGRVEVWRANTGSVTGLALRVDTGADGDMVMVADFDGDGQPEPLWQNASGALTISYLRPRSEGNFGSLERNVTLVGLPGDDQLVVRGAAELSSQPGYQILVQNMQTHAVGAIFPSVENAASRAPLFDLTDPFELVYVR